MAPIKPTIDRFAIRWSREGGSPRSRLELNVLHALGTILDKCEWWVSWTASPDERATWLADLEDELIETNVRQVLAVWPANPAKCLKEVDAQLTEEAQETDVGTKMIGIEELVEHVMYPPPEDHFEEGYDYDEDGETPADETFDDESDGKEDASGEGDSGDEVALNAAGDAVPFDQALAEAEELHGVKVSWSDDVVDEDDDDDEEDDELDELLAAHHEKNPFGQIAWYVNMATLRTRLRKIAPADWTPESIRDPLRKAQSTRGDAALEARVCSLILAVLRSSADGDDSDDDNDDKDGGPCSLVTLATHLPEETRVDVLQILQLHFKRIRTIVETAKQDISVALDTVVQQLELATSRDKPHIVPGPVPRTWLSDDLISAELKATFVDQVAVLENVPDDEKDWRAHSNGQVLDLVTPSLYCGIARQTTRVSDQLATSLLRQGSVAEHTRKIVSAPTTDTLWSVGCSGDFINYSWLPCEIDVDKDTGNATILTAINNLHPDKYARLYMSIQSIFTLFVPLFETVLSALDRQAEERATNALYAYGNQTLPCAPCVLPPGLFEVSKPTLSLKGSRCQVIVKLTEIHLTPGKPQFPGGDWHNEGSDAERIVATGVYCFSIENIDADESCVSLRTFVKEPKFEPNDNVGIGLAYGMKDNQVLAQELGSVTVLDDRCVVYPNIYQLGVTPFQLADASKSGVRKILMFCLVDPTHDPIPSTAVVPPQQATWIEWAREPPLKRLRLPEIIEQHIKDYSREGMDLAQAKTVQDKAVKERKSQSHHRMKNSTLVLSRRRFY